MIQSITIKRNGSESVVTPGRINIDAAEVVAVSAKASTITIGKKATDNEDNKYTRYINNLKSCPYVSTISDVSGDDWNNLWIVGGKTTQIDFNKDLGTFSICDMSQTVDYPRIYKSVYAMLRQLRLWIDAHKDTFLLSDTFAQGQWDNMLKSNDDWYVSNTSDNPDKRPMYLETRPRTEISSLGPALNLINEYFGIITLWNHAVGIPMSNINSRVHPADMAGIYIGIDVLIPMSSKESTDIKIVVSASFTGQSGEGLYTWLRIPIIKVTPGIGSSNIESDLDGEKVSGTNASILDTGFQKPGSSVEFTISFTISKEDIATTHIAQCVLEAIPFFLCSEKEKTYADSKRSEHFSEQGENEWTITVQLYRDGELISTLNDVKRTAYASVCEEASSSGEVS